MLAEIDHFVDFEIYALMLMMTEKKEIEELKVGLNKISARKMIDTLFLG